MKSLIILLVIFIIPFFAYCQQEISIDSVNGHEGQIVKVCTKIFSTKYLESAKGSPTFLNAGGNYPNAPLTILIWGDKRSGFKNAPDVYFKGKNICITGKIKMYKGKPEIIADNEDQIEIK